jgi:hypothetical protein
MAMQIVRMRISGNGSILMNNPVSMRSQTPGLKRAGKQIPDPKDEATSKLYALPNGQLYIKADSFREAGLLAAGEVRDSSRKGRATMTRRFAASVFLSKDTLPLERKNGKPITAAEKDWEIDIRRVVVQKNGILRARPKISDWCCDLEFEFDDESIDPDVILQIMQMAGKYPGILDYRVGKKGPFGRFTAELIEANSAKTKKTKRERELESV